MSGRYQIHFSPQAAKDVLLLPPKMRTKLKDIVTHVLAENPYQGKKLIGDLAGSYSYRLNLKDRIVYSIHPARKMVYIERARTHYGN